MASSRRSHSVPGRTRAIVPATRATTGAGRRWTSTFRRSCSTTGSFTVRPWAEATATAALSALPS